VLIETLFRRTEGNDTAKTIGQSADP